MTVQEIQNSILDRQALKEAVSKILPRGGTFFLIDCGDMNRISESFGKDFGSRILSELAEELKKLCRESDLIGHTDGDEFLIFMPKIMVREEIGKVVERLRQSIQREMTANNLVETVQKGTGIAAVTTEGQRFDSFDEILGCLRETLRGTSEEKPAADSDSIFRNVFSTQIQSALSVEELTAAMQAMNNTHNANYFVRLEDLSYVVLKDRELFPGDENPACKNAQQLIAGNIRKKVKPEFQKSFFEFADLGTLAARMSDTDSIKFEYQNILREWCLAAFSVIERKNGIVTKVIFLISNLTSSRAEAQELLKMQKEAISLLSSSELLFISVINKNTGASRVIQSTRLINTNRVFDFDKSMEREAAHMIPSESRVFLQNSSLERVREELKKNDHYVITSVLQLPDSGRCRKVSYHFTNSRDSEEYILAATEDITEPFTKDPVTGMKNYEGFKLDLIYEITHAPIDSFVVINFNILNFKAINSMYGYETGNWLLKTVFRRLLDPALAFRSVCRENADNFFCLCRKEDYDFETLNQLCKMKVTDGTGLSENLELFCGIYPVSGSNESLNEICDKARIGRRQAEQEIGVNIYVLSDRAREQYMEEAVILSSVHEAILNKELVVYYQPIYDAQNGKLSSAEALVRWQHPQKGLIPPNVFIPAVERTGQIADIDLYVGRHVENFQRERLTSGKKTIPVSINVSRYDFLQEEYMKNILASIRKRPELANVLRIEITESGLINIPGSGECFMQEMRGLGIKTMIDDFGTGYSSLASLIDRHCDMIKLDMSFAKQIGIKKKMEILVVSAIETAHRLGVKVVAEGVETKEQLEFLKTGGCDYIQGYYFSRPLPQSVFEELLDKE